MTEYSKNISFWSLLISKKIVIPIIQRDYAQGRIGKEYLRERFLGQLFDALQQQNTELVLDFVYGSVEKGVLYPLDGQQRLTTLWLLHWYLALCAGTLEEDKKVLQRFSYETRVSSRTFCQKLCEIDESYTPQKHGIAAFIRNQRWYYSAYEQDPTIQSMLRMLDGTNIKDSNATDITDGIEEYFININTEGKALELLEKLKDKEKAPIKFYLLNMEDKNMPLTDDLYIKMNARGKALTDFENFKADLLKYKVDDRKYLIPENDASEDSFRVLMDTRWTDIFWNFHSEEYRIDEIYMSFLNRFFLNWYIANTESKQKEIINDNLYKMLSATDKEEGKTDCHYQSITVYEPIFITDCIRVLTACLNNLCELYEEKDKQTIDELFRPYWKSDKQKSSNTPFYFIPRYETGNSPYTLTYPQQVVFHAICVYLSTCKKVELERLKDWIHFVWNMVENSDIDKVQSISAIRFFAKGINELPKLGDEAMLVNASDDITAYLSGIDESQIKDTFGRRQLLEEIAKAKQIMKAPDWKEKIYAAENFAFFKGAIAFLFTDGDGKTDWNNFDKKLETARLLFNKGGVQADQRVKALRTLYSYCDDFNSQFWRDAKIFNWSTETWKENILTKVNASNEYIYAKPVHHLLMGDAPSEEKKQDERLQLLANESFVTFLVKENKNNEDMYIRDPHNALYYCGRKYGVMLEHKMRDSYLNQLLDANKIELTDSNNRIADTGLFWGNFSINFIYHANGKDLHLQWYRQRNNREYDIYLMTEDWNYMRRTTKLENEQGDRQDFYCFNIEKPADGISYIEYFCQLVETEFKEFIENNNI
ncbi:MULTISPECIES: DUF262 domain-containing protein [Bacteroides]|uniref:DUF262 domain-containing protein n=1 Tax=Bacteroides TaxID=816 RepID=UPI000B36BEDC|nr:MULTISPECIES: DUF262 domain-containing protein [Bacteroides]MBM6945796.1 DUF262 domain-containing protein [Bacteroides gallinaceum]OUO59362.1 hypothetical protein B5F78_05890 [Bacteroides sp. An279]